MITLDAAAKVGIKKITFWCEAGRQQFKFGFSKDF